MTASILHRHHVKLSDGEGTPTVVFVHGFGCEQRIWRSVEPPIAATHRTMTFDMAGCGQALDAWDPDRHATLEGYAQDLLDILEAAGLERVVCVGHSVGSIITLLAALRQPARFSRMVLVAPSPRFLNDPPDYVGGFERHELEGIFQLMESNHFGWAQLLAPLAIGEHNPSTLTEDFEKALCALEPRIARHFARLAFEVDVRDRLPGVIVPSVIVQCTRDALAPVEVGRWMHQHLPGSALTVLDISGHCPHISHPDRIVGVVRAVLAG